MNCASSRPEDPSHPQQPSCRAARIGRLSRLTSDAERPILRTDLRGRFASVLREAGSEDCFSTLRRNVPRARSQAVARIHFLNPHCSGSQLSPRSTSVAITSLSLALASPSSRLSLRSTRSAGCSLDDDFGRAHRCHLSDGRCELGFSEDSGMRTRTTSPGGRLMDLHTAAAYLGCSYWTLRDLVLGGHVPAVRIPSPRATRWPTDATDPDRLARLGSSHRTVEGGRWT